MSGQLGIDEYERLAGDIVALRDRELKIEQRHKRRQRWVRKRLPIVAILVAAIALVAYVALLIALGGVCG